MLKAFATKTPLKPLNQLSLRWGGCLFSGTADRMGVPTGWLCRQRGRPRSAEMGEWSSVPWTDKRWVIYSLAKPFFYERSVTIGYVVTEYRHISHLELLFYILDVTMHSCLTRFVFLPARGDGVRGLIDRSLGPAHFLYKTQRLNARSEI